MAANRDVLLGLVEEFVSGQQDSKAAETATGVKTGQFTVLELVEALGLSLTSPEPQTRGRGVQLLSLVLQECYVNVSESEVEVLITFYENRLKDHYAITPHVLQGINALTKCTLPSGLSVSILRSLFQDVHVQGLGADFVFGFVQAMDGERDPRNLLLAFQIAQSIIYRGYELGKFTEELFEVTSCYFPIDFTPPPNDPHGITQEDLIMSLRAVLTGTPRFAEVQAAVYREAPVGCVGTVYFVSVWLSVSLDRLVVLLRQYLLPLIIEKIDSDVQSAKLDSLQTLTACTAVYTHKDLAEFLSGLWTSLRREVFQTASEKVETASLSSLKALAACLSRSVQKSDSDDALQGFLDLVLTDCKHHLCEPDLKLVWPSAKILQAVASASYRASHKITGAVVPVLLEQYKNSTQCAQRRTLLEVVQGFVQPVQSSLPGEGDESVLSGFQEPLCSLVFSALCESSTGLQVTSTRVLTALGQQPGLLSVPDVELAADHLTRLVLEEEESEVCSAILECSGSLARLFPTAFISKMIPKLKEEIFSEPMEQGESNAPKHAHSQQAVRQRCVKTLAAVSSKASVAQESAPILLEVLSSAHSGSCSFSLEEVVSACHSLQRIAAQAQDTEDVGRLFHDIIIPRLLGLAVQAALHGEGEGARNSPLTEESVLFSLVLVMSTACGRLQSQLAILTASRAVSLFLDGDVSFLPENDLPSPLQLLKKQPEAWRQSQLVCLLMACVCSMPRSVEIPQIDRLFCELEELSCTCTHPFAYTSAAKCFAGLLNKRPGGEELDSMLERTMKRISSELDCASSSFRVQAFTLLLWVTKALLIRYHPLSTVLTDKSFGQDKPVFGHPAVLLTCPRRSPTDRKSGYLKALSHIVNHLPRRVQITELPALLPLLLEALSCTEQGNVRIASLRCLHALSRLPEHMLLPFRARVIRALAVPLDDKKRLVRKEAVLARAEWFLLGSPGR
ncbi:hypothetical protein JZ751_007944 [Albula glossodonta]|uniref:MMS19 nucleotide excision repair protein n=1 Tax=Albula glossodonta TaxID=121402 RepID=A0A8T2P324_9TELE|nr:hypothetical protein JZ751_007944 [Albula glossodonta]